MVDFMGFFLILQRCKLLHTKKIGILFKSTIFISIYIKKKPKLLKVNTHLHFHKNYVKDLDLKNALNLLVNFHLVK